MSETIDSNLLESAVVDVLPDDAEQYEEPPAEEEEFLPPPVFEVFDWNTSLVSQFCREGDIDHLRMFIEYSQQASACGKHATQIADRLELETGLSPLHHVARYQQLEICVMLLSNIEFNFGVNIKDDDGRTPVHSAFRSSNILPNTRGHLNVEGDFGNKIQSYDLWQEEYTNKILTSEHPMVYLFARVKGDLNARDKYLLTPLHYAVARNNLAGVKQLIQCDADIEAEDRQGIRPLHIACREGYLSIVQYLIEAEARIDGVDADLWTPIHFAASRGHFEVLQWIQTKEKQMFSELIRMKTNAEATCLHLAVQSGQIDLVTFLLDQFDSTTLTEVINEQAEPFGTPLHFAAKFCDPSMIDLLYHRGADPLIVNSNGQSALHLASLTNRLLIVEELHRLTGTSLLEIKDNQGRTALSLTTDSEIVEELIRFGADPSSVDHEEMNALMIAVANGQLLIVERFLSLLSDRWNSVLDQVEKNNARGIFLIAVQTGHVDLCAFLLKHPSIRWDSLDKQRLNLFHLAARHNFDSLIHFFAEVLRESESMLQRLINAQDVDGKTPLHFAAEHGHTASLEILLKNEADILIPNHLGQLPLHLAVQNGQSTTVDRLLQAGRERQAEFHSTLARRQSPLIVACQNGFAQIVEHLLNEEIGIFYALNTEEDNPLETAIKHRRVQTIHVILENAHAQYWLESIRKTRDYDHQTPLRDLIRSMPDCAAHAMDKCIVKSTGIHFPNQRYERTLFQYKYLDDYFTKNDQLYSKRSKELYRNHPLIIALDFGHYSLLEHPLALQLMMRKWELYRKSFYIPRCLSFLLLFILTIYVLIVPAPVLPSDSKTSTNFFSSIFLHAVIPIRWIIIILSLLNLLKILFEIVLFRGLRVPFAQLFGIFSFITSIVAFLPYGDSTAGLVARQWQLSSIAILFQWLNSALILRSMPFFGNYIVLLESVLKNLTKLIVVMLPLFIAFMISSQMLFFNQASFVTIFTSIHKSAAMLVGELDFETLLFSKPTLSMATVMFVPFLILMTIAFMNLLLALTVGDTKGSMVNTKRKANAYWIREIIFLETILPTSNWIKSNIVENEVIERNHHDSSTNVNEEKEQSYPIEVTKLLDILEMLCIQAKQTVDAQIELEQTLRHLLDVASA